MQERHCVLITGPAHSGTRLLVRMLEKHPDVSVPTHILSPVAEFKVLHSFFIRTMDVSPLYRDEYVIDYDELRLILDAYIMATDPDKSSFVLKMPYYPFLCLDWLVDTYFGGNVSLVFTDRDEDKVAGSFIRRGEDVLFFKKRHEEIFRQVKKLPLARRKYYLSTLDSAEFFKELTRHNRDLRDAWNAQRPDKPFVTVDMAELAESEDYLRQVLDEIGLDTQHAATMYTIVDSDRLIHGQADKNAGPDVRAMLREFIPPILWRAVRRIKR